MKKYTILFLVLMLISTLFSSCGSENSQNDGFEIVSTVFPCYDFAKQIGGEKVNSTLLVSPGSESHSYEVTLEDISRLSKCDMFIYGGGDSDVWVDDIFESNPELREKSFSMIEYLENLGEGIIYIDCDEEEHTGKEPDEHVWTSPRNAQRICRGIAEKMSELSVENAEYFMSNLDEYNKKLEELDKEFSEISQNAKSKQIVFEGRFPFRYLCHDYGFEHISVIDGCSSNTEISLADINYLTDCVSKMDKKVIFYTEFSDCTVADAVSNATGAEKMFLHSCHNLTGQESENITGYFELMQQNAEALKEALCK